MNHEPYLLNRILFIIAVLAVGIFGLFAPLAPFRNLFLTGLEGCRKHFNRRFMFLVLALCLLTGFGLAGEAQPAFANAYAKATTVKGATAR